MKEQQYSNDKTSISNIIFLFVGAIIAVCTVFIAVLFYSKNTTPAQGAGQPCQTGADCGPGENCVAGVCAVASTCGNGICDPGETAPPGFPGSCNSDCVGGAVCGNGLCESTETQTSCPSDCTTNVCGDGICGPGEGSSCPPDCGGGFCGDGLCSAGEDPLSCPPDCGSGFCGDGLCSPSENFYCPQDCGGGNLCGNATCEPGENYSTCPLDCGCTNNNECYPGSVCDTGSGQCFQCNNDSDCNAGTVCQNHSCIAVTPCSCTGIVNSITSWKNNQMKNSAIKQCEQLTKLDAANKDTRKTCQAKCTALLSIGKNLSTADKQKLVGFCNGLRLQMTEGNVCVPEPSKCSNP